MEAIINTFSECQSVHFKQLGLGHFGSSSRPRENRPPRSHGDQAYIRYMTTVKDCLLALYHS